MFFIIFTILAFLIIVIQKIVINTTKETFERGKKQLKFKRFKIIGDDGYQRYIAVFDLEGEEVEKVLASEGRIISENFRDIVKKIDQETTYVKKYRSNYFIRKPYLILLQVDVLSNLKDEKKA